MSLGARSHHPRLSLLTTPDPLPLLPTLHSVLSCEAPSLMRNSYCVHCGSRAGPLVCVASGGNACRATLQVWRCAGLFCLPSACWCLKKPLALSHSAIKFSTCISHDQGKAQVLPLCSSLSPLGADDGACFASVQGMALAFNAEPLLLASLATCPSATDCNCAGGAAGMQLPRRVLPYYHRPCGAASLPAGTLPKCISVSATGRQQLSSCLVEAAHQLRCYSEVTVGGRSFWVLDHVCSEPLSSSLAPASAVAECTGPAAAAVMAAAAPVTAAVVKASIAAPRKRQRRPASGAALVFAALCCPCWRAPATQLFAWLHLCSCCQAYMFHNVVRFARGTPALRVQCKSDWWEALPTLLAGLS